MRSIGLYGFVTFLLGFTLGHPEVNSKPADGKCRLATLIPSDLVLPEVDLGNVGDSPIPVPDPLQIQNVSITLKEEIISGTYSLRNGVITGLSSISHDFDFNPLIRRLQVNATLKKASITGDYEIIDGRVNLTELGVHTISGAGPLRGFISEVVASVGVSLNIDPETDYLSIKDLQVGFNFQNASIVAENLTLDGQPVNWNELNEILKPTFDSIWGEAQEVYVQLIQDQVNWLLEGCTLMDLLQLLKPKP